MQAQRLGSVSATKKRRPYQPRIVGGQVMMPADLERLHKYMLEIEASTISRMKCARLWRVSGQNSHTSCRRQSRRGRRAEATTRPDRRGLETGGRDLSRRTGLGRVMTNSSASSGLHFLI